MRILFTRNGTAFIAKVEGRGFYHVDAGEQFRVRVGMAILLVKVSEAEIVG